jgi:penicillin G amidase
MGRGVKPGRRFIPIAVAVAVLAATAGVFVRHEIHAGFPRAAGTATIRGLRAAVRVIRDRRGIPHIRARSEWDAMVALGYVHAQDRLFQMEMARRACRGTIAEVLGERGVEADLLHRLLELEKLARRNFTAAPIEAKTAAVAYARGVNALLREGRSLPLEFRLLRFAPAPWEPWEEFCTPLLVGWVLSRNLAEELLALHLVGKLGLPGICALMPSAPGAHDPCEAYVASFADLRFGAPLRALEAERRLAHGSNAMAVGPARSRSARPLLESDPHLGVSLPGVWYEADVAAGVWRVAGATLPGGPLFPIGTNGSLAWGVTNAAADQVDLYVVQLDPRNPARYRVGETWANLPSEQITLALGRGERTTRTVYRTEYGPLITEISGGVSAAAALRWAATLPDDGAAAFHSLLRAQTVGEGFVGLRGLGVPALNVILADGEGHVGWRVAGALPARAGYSGRFPADGSSGGHRWEGRLADDALPRALDPPEGYLVSANDAPREGAERIGHDFSGPWRARRLGQLLSAGGDLSPADLAHMQLDVRSVMADAVLPAILSTPVVDPAAARTQAALRAWDHDVRAASREAALFEIFLDQAAHEIFGVTTGERFPEVLASFAFNYDALEDALLGGPARRFVGPGAIERALANAWRRQGEGGTRWGRLHRVRFRSALGRLPLLGAWADRGPFSRDGDTDTVNVGAWVPTDPFAVAVHPSFRFVVDLARPWEAIAANPTGESGQPGHPHYDDLMAQWLRGETHRLPLDGADLAHETEGVLVLRP